MTVAVQSTSALARFTATAADVDTDPIAALADSLARSRARADLLGKLLAESYAKHGLDALRVRTTVLDRSGRAHPGGEQPTALARLEAEERDRLGRLSVAAIRCGIAAKRLQLEADESHRMVDAIMRAVERVEPDTTRRTEIFDAVANELDALGGGQA